MTCNTVHLLFGISTNHVVEYSWKENVLLMTDCWKKEKFYCLIGRLINVEFVSQDNQRVTTNSPILNARIFLKHHIRNV